MGSDAPIGPRSQIIAGAVFGFGNHGQFFPRDGATPRRLFADVSFWERLRNRSSFADNSFASCVTLRVPFGFEQQYEPAPVGESWLPVLDASNVVRVGPYIGGDSTSKCEPKNFQRRYGVYHASWEYSRFRVAWDEDWDFIFVWPETIGSERPAACIEAEGVVSEEGRYGHLGGAKREFYVARILSFEPFDASADPKCAGMRQVFLPRYRPNSAD